MSVVDIIKILLSKRKFLIIILSIFTVFGVYVAIVAKKEFTTGASFLPQESSTPSFSGSLGGLASLAGISGLSGSGSEMNPLLYPKIVNSINFRLKLINAPITVAESGTIMTYREYYENEHELTLVGQLVGLPKLIIKSIKGESAGGGPGDGNSEFVSITREEKNHFRRLEEQISVSVSENEGIIYLSFTMPEPLMAAQMAEFCQDLLQEELIAFQIKNAKTKLEFIQERYNEKKAGFEEVQAKLASFQDKNRGLVTAVSQSRLESIRSEYDIAFTIYKEMAAQLEEAKLKVSSDTPVFSVLEPVTVPIDKSYPNRPLILFLFVFLGFFVGAGWVFAKHYYLELKKQF
jgi:uncharacterized protein involved in exopolysaccharide biosynthesis